MIVLFSVIPFRVLYLLSDFIYFLLYRIFKYRYKVIQGNLVKCFPEKSAAEIEVLVKSAYRNFCDILLEGIKGMGMDEHDIARRFKVINPEFLQTYFDAGKDVILCASHYANWEWGISLGAQFSHYVKVTYKPIKNQHINNHVERSRAFENLSTVPMKKTYDYIKSKAHNLSQTNSDFLSGDFGKPRCLILIADQSPANVRAAQWHTFLGRDTAFLTGPESIGKQFDIPLVYADVQRIKRGFYEIELSKVHDNPTQTETGDITKIYVQKLEKIIQKKPENWLWTHRRWKKKREQVSS